MTLPQGGSVLGEKVDAGLELEHAPARHAPSDATDNALGERLREGKEFV
jgi:hypothetical protein